MHCAVRLSLCPLQRTFVSDCVMQSAKAALHILKTALCSSSIVTLVPAEEMQEGWEWLSRFNLPLDVSWHTDSLFSAPLALPSVFCQAHHFFARVKISFS